MMMTVVVVVTKFYLSGVIVGQNYIQLLNTALNDLLFSKICFIKSSENMLQTGVPQIREIRDALL